MVSRSVLILALLSILFGAPALAEENVRKRVAVIPFDVAASLEAEEPQLGTSLSLFAGAVLSKSNEVLDRAAFEKARLEMKKTVAELQDNLELGVPLGVLMKAELLIHGRVSSFGGRLVLHMKVLHVAGRRWGMTRTCLADSIESLPEAVPLLLGHLGFPKSEPEENRPEVPAAEAPAEPPKMPAPGVRGKVPPRQEKPRSFLEQLDDPDAGVRFAAAVELGKGKGKGVDPVARLVRVLQEDWDTFVRRAAARALGELHAVAAVPALIDCLADKEFFVGVTVHKSLQGITRHDFGFREGLTRTEIRRLVEAGKAWWSEHKPK